VVITLALTIFVLRTRTSIEDDRALAEGECAA